VRKKKKRVAVVFTALTGIMVENGGVSKHEPAVGHTNIMLAVLILELVDEDKTKFQFPNHVPNFRMISRKSYR